MTIIDVDINKIIPYPNNARKNDKTVKGLVESIKEFGFWQPLVLDKDNVVVCGHARLKAAKQLKMKSLPCVYVNDLTEKQIEVFRLADNKTAEISMWDNDLLCEELTKVGTIEMGRFGFEDAMANMEMTIEDANCAIIIDCDNEAERDTLCKSLIEQGYQCEVL